MSERLVLAEQAYGVSTVGNRKAALSAFTGFFFAFRVMFVLLVVRVFQAESDAGVVASLLINGLLFMAALLSPAAKQGRSFRQILHQPCFVCAATYLALTGISLSWSVADSLPSAIAFWTAMAADAGIVFFQLREHQPQIVLEELARGYVYAACLVALIAWILPAQSDMRLGDEELLGPNQIGWVCGFGFFFAQYLLRTKVTGPWVWCAAILGITLLRSLSKTTIIAFIAAQCLLLWRDNSVSRRTKQRLIFAAIAACALLGGVISSYLTDYGNSNSPESLTGRLGIWTYILSESLDNPVFGHGFHSVWKVIPLFYGTFQARHAHNELLQQFYAYGAIGVALLVTTYTRIAMTIRRMSSSSKALWAALLLFVMIRCLADTEAFDYSWPMWLIVLFGAIAASDQEKEAPACE